MGERQERIATLKDTTFAGELMKFTSREQAVMTNSLSEWVICLGTKYVMVI